jgi:hypothetical protein
MASVSPGYRSFGREEVLIRDLARLNVFIGKNNCGKSNILRFVKHMGYVFTDRNHSGAPPKLDPQLDYMLGDTNRIAAGLQIRKDGFSSSIFQHIVNAFEKAQIPPISAPGDEMWFEFTATGERTPTPESLSRWREIIARQYNAGATNRITSALLNYRDGTPE